MSETERPKSASCITISDKTFDCTATPYAWPHGLGVDIKVAASGKHVSGVRVLCSLDQPDFDTLAALSPQQLCDLALSRFTMGELPVTLDTILSWQETIESMGYHYVSPLISSFSRAAPS
jgi:hypothetical protein